MDAAGLADGHGFTRRAVLGTIDVDIRPAGSADQHAGNTVTSGTTVRLKPRPDIDQHRGIIGIEQLPMGSHTYLQEGHDYSMIGWQVAERNRWVRTAGKQTTRATLIN